MLHVVRRNQRKSTISPAPRVTVLDQRELKTYFEHAAAGVEVLAEGLTEVRFGEYLVEKRVCTRNQLFRALQLQDRNPGVRIGECLAALGYAGIGEVEQRFRDFCGIAAISVG